MGATATPEQVDEVVARLEEAGCAALVTPGREATVIGAIGERELLAALPLEGYAGVEQVLPILKPYKLVSRELSPDPTVIEVRGRRIGDGHFGFIAGPCTVETREQTLETARVVAAEGVTMLRGGAFKPRTSPYAFQGLGERALAEPLEGVGRGAWLERAAAEHRHALGRDYTRRLERLLTGLDRARARDEAEVAVADAAAANLDHRGIRRELAAHELVRLQDRQHLLDARVALERQRREQLALADR